MAEGLHLSVDQRGWARITFDQPQSKVNLLTSELLTEVVDALDRLAPGGGTDAAGRNGSQPAAPVQALIFDSAKPGCFLAGADVGEISSLPRGPQTEEKLALGQEVMNRIEALPCPTLCLIDGVCLGGGLELALACTYRIATDDAKTRLGLPEVSLGIIPGFGGTQRLPRLVGAQQALKMILAGKPVDAKSALRIGLVDALFPKEFLAEKSVGFLEGVLAVGGARPARRRARGAFLLEGNPVGRAILYGRARAEVRKRSGRHYPAPFAAIEVIRRTYRARGKEAPARTADRRALERGLAAERSAFAALHPGQVSRNLLRLFFTGEALKKETGKGLAASTGLKKGHEGPSSASASSLPAGARPFPNGKPARTIAAAGVLGAGVMGGGIAWLFASNRIPVRMKDIAWEAVAKGFSSASLAFGELVKRKRLEARAADLAMHRISGTIDFSGFSSLDVVIEAIVERVTVKREALSELEKHLRPDALIATNTSSLSVSEIAKGLERPERFAGMHFFNPVNRMPLVEIVPGERTSPETVTALVALAKRLGKSPIVVRDRPGFLVNRVLLAYLGEAVLLFEQGVDFLLIDRILEEFGMPMGPFTLIDEVGNDIAFEVAKVLSAAYGERIPLPKALGTLTEEKHLLGRKGGAGFYLYAGKRKRPNGAVRALFPAKRPRMGAEEIRDRLLFAMVNEASRCLEEGIVERPDYLDMALILGIGFPPFRGGILRYADDCGPARVVERLERFRESAGERFAPSALLARMAQEGDSFYGQASMRSEEREPRGAKRPATASPAAGPRERTTPQPAASALGAPPARRSAGGPSRAARTRRGR